MSTNSSQARHTALLAGVFVLSSLGPAYAYVDPGSAGLIVTAVLGAIATIGYTARLYWSKLLIFFKHGKTGEPERGEDSR